jgi:hypothetical protein
MGAVKKMRLPGSGASGNSGNGGFIIGAAFVSSRSGMSGFWIWHGSIHNSRFTIHNLEEFVLHREL